MKRTQNSMFFFLGVNFDRSSLAFHSRSLSQPSMSPRTSCDKKSMNCNTVDFPTPFRPIKQLNFAKSSLKPTSDLKLFYFD